MKACIPKTYDYVNNLLNDEYNLYQLFTLYNIFNVRKWNKMNNNDDTKFISYINKKINQIIKEQDKLKFNFKNIIRNSINDLIFSDDIFFAKEIIENYKPYQLKEADVDSNYLRLNWLHQQDDYGRILL